LKRKEFLNGVIDEFLSDPVSETGKYLKSVLAKIKDPEVEAAAQDMVESGDTVTMMIGLDLLGDLGIANPKTYDITSKILEQPDESSPEMLMRAIYAMPVMHLSDPEITNTIDQLGYLASNHSHDGVRSNSIFKIVKWAKDYQDLESVVQALDKNRSTDDRISAAMAISQSNVIDDDLRETLLSRMTDEEELWEIRRYAAESLSRFKLRDRDQQLYEAFRREQEKIKR
jgi:beta-galactosidase GanA